MVKPKVDASGPTDPVPAPGGGEAWHAPDLVTAAATLGVVAAGVALFEVALIPGMVIGGAAVLAPRYLPGLRRRMPSLFRSIGGTGDEREAPAPKRSEVKAAPAVHRLAIRQMVAKTITFRIIVTSLDFTANYLVIGELATAAGLSAFALVVGPLFYFVHETAWNSVGASVNREPGRWGPAIDIPVLAPRDPAVELKPSRRKTFTINRAVAKTITFRTFATTMDFTTNYLVVGDLAMAAGLSAFGFAVGPFVYLGHEMIWDRYGWLRPDAVEPPLMLAGPVPEAV